MRRRRRRRRRSSPRYEDEDEDILTQDREVLGAFDAATEKKQRERAAAERWLARFLFGKVASWSDIFFIIFFTIIIITFIIPVITVSIITDTDTDYHHCH